MWEGRYPQSRHDGLAWGQDARREGLSNTKLKVRCILLFVKADWSEIAHSFGFPTWSDGMRPCFFCNGVGHSLYQVSNASLGDIGFRLNLEDE